jgi:hypothetical protein
VSGDTAVVRGTAVCTGTAIGAPARRALAVLVLVAAVLGIAGLGVLAPTPVLGACATAPQPADEAVLFGDVVFVGTVLRTENQGRWATVRIEERWKGSDGLAETVSVHGGPEPGAATEVDRTFVPGRYLFIVRDDGGTLADDACSGTRPWTDDLAALRPAGVTPAAADLPTDPIGSIAPEDIATIAALIGALLIAIVAYLWVLRARRRPPDWLR